MIMSNVILIVCKIKRVEIWRNWEKMTICCSLIQTQTLAMIISGKKYICFCEPIWWASTQRAALYHSQPPVGFCPWPVTSHIPAMLACLQWTGAHQLDSALALASVIRLLYDRQSKIPLDRLTQGLTQIPPTLTQQKNKPYVNKATHVFTASPAPTLWIWITLWPRF